MPTRGVSARSYAASSSGEPSRTSSEPLIFFMIFFMDFPLDQPGRLGYYSAMLTITLGAGTKYTVENPDGTQSEPKSLEATVEAGLVMLEDDLYAFQLADQVIFVKPQDLVEP